MLAYKLRGHGHGAETLRLLPRLGLNHSYSERHPLQPGKAAVQRGPHRKNGEEDIEKGREHAVEDRPIGKRKLPQSRMYRRGVQEIRSRDETAEQKGQQPRIGVLKP